MEKKLLITIASAIGILSCLFYTSNHYLILLALVSFPLLLILSFKYCILCIKNLPSNHFKTPIFISGIILIIGASLADNIVTLIKNPDLSRESNIITISMFKQGFSLYEVIFLDALFQIIFTIASVLLWILCYKSIPIIAHNLKSKNLLKKIMLIFGMEKFTLKKSFFTVEEAFYVNAYIGMGMLCACVYRLYCILEWLEWVPMSRVIAPMIVFVISNLAYVSYLVFHSNSLKNNSNEAQVNTQ